MKKLTMSIAALALLTISANAGDGYVPAPVEPIAVPVVDIPLGLYLGGGFTYASSECQCDSSVKFTNGKTSRINKSTSYGLNLKAGYTYNKYLAVEAKYLNTTLGKNKGFTHYGLYLKPTYAITDNLDIYALLGYGSTKCEILKGSQKGFAWGAGAEYTLNKKVNGFKDGASVYVEYLRPLKKTGNKNITIDTVNAGVSYHF